MICRSTRARHNGNKNCCFVGMGWVSVAGKMQLRGSSNASPYLSVSYIYIYLYIYYWMILFSCSESLCRFIQAALDRTKRKTMCGRCFLFFSTILFVFLFYFIFLFFCLRRCWIDELQIDDCNCLCIIWIDFFVFAANLFRNWIDWQIVHAIYIYYIRVTINSFITHSTLFSFYAFHLLYIYNFKTTIIMY